MMQEFTVKQAAQETGLNAHTLRYYERIGLMDRVARAVSGHRRYTGGDLEWITLLQRLRSTGMPISEMKRFADFVREGEHTIPERRKLLEFHERKLKAQREEIDKTLAVLSEKLSHYRASEAALQTTTKKIGGN